jgi:hypothetical protein
MMAGKSLAIAGVGNKAMIQLQRVAPRAAVRAVAAKLNSV